MVIFFIILIHNSVFVVRPLKGGWGGGKKNNLFLKFEKKIRKRARGEGRKKYYYYHKFSIFTNDLLLIFQYLWLKTSRNKQYYCH